MPHVRPLFRRARATAPAIRSAKPTGRVTPWPVRLGVEALETRVVPAVYDVGPGQPLATVGAVPWGTLAPGDTVRIHWQPTPYHEFILLSTRGTAAAPIRVQGVAGPNGERPVLDGQNATTGPNINF